MSIIYSYPTSQPTVDDLLIGTDVADDNATKSFTVQSLVSLINAQAGSGTLTSTTISTDAFLTAVGNPTGPAVAYTIGLSALGTPSSTTFLRGDNQWVTPTVTSGISVLGQSASPPITTDLSQLNFTGAGVVTSSSGSGGVQVNILGAVNAVESIVAGTGIGLSGPTGNVIVTNTGITGLIDGDGIAISTTAAGVSTISATVQTTGTVTSVTAGAGLELTGTASIDPAIALNYTGADTYITQPVAAVPLAADLIPFHSVTGSAVKKVTFGQIQASTLALVNTAITTSDADSVKNNTDTYTSVPTTANVITLLDSEYNTLVSNGTTVANTLYLTTSTAPTTGTVQFTVVDTGIVTNDGCGFNVTTTCSPAFTDGTNLTNVAVGTQYTLTSYIAPVNSGCNFYGTNPQQVSGTVAAGTTPITQNLTGSVYIPATPQGGNNLGTIGPISGGVLNQDYTVSPTSGSSTGNLGAAVTSYSVTALIINAAKELTQGSLIGVQSSNTYTNPYSTATVSFPNTTLATKTFTLSYTVTPSGGLASGYGSTWQLVVGGSFSGSSFSGSITGQPYGSGWTFTAEAVGINGNTVTGSSWSGTSSGNLTSNTAISGNLTGTVQSNTGSASMVVDTTGLTGPSAGYTITLTPAGYTSGAAVSGAVGSTVNFAAAISLNSGYTATSPLSVVYNGNQGVVIPGSVTATISGAVAVTSTRVSSSCSQMYPASSMPGNCFVNRGATVWLGKSGGSASYPQSGDIAYSSQYGSGNLSDGAYAVYAASNAYMIVSSGSITSVTPCSP